MAFCRTGAEAVPPLGIANPASLLIAQGVQPRVDMEALGHSTIATAMNIYAHVVPALQREAADRLDTLLG